MKKTFVEKVSGEDEIDFHETQAVLDVQEALGKLKGVSVTSLMMGKFDLSALETVGVIHLAYVSSLEKRISILEAKLEG